MNETALQLVTSWAAAGLALAGSSALLIRRFSKQRTEMTKDRTESRFVELLLEERDSAMASAREAWKGHQAASEAIARLSAQNTHQAAEIERLNQEFASFKRMLVRLYPETRQFLSSDFPPLIKEPRPT